LVAAVWELSRYLPAQTRPFFRSDLPHSFYADEVQKILNDDIQDHLEELVNKAGSSGGARPKVDGQHKCQEMAYQIQGIITSGKCWVNRI